MDGMYPQDGGFIQAIESFWFAELKFSEFGNSEQHGGGDRQAGVERYDRWYRRQSWRM